MRILVVSATSFEIEPLVGRLRHVSDTGLRSAAYRFREHDVEVLTTGVGMVATSAWCSRACAAEHYDLALNFGLCGSFDPSMQPGTIVHVTADRFAELGAEDGEDFLSIHQLSLLGENEFPYEAGMLINTAPPPLAPLAGLPTVAGITVNTVHGNEFTIEAVRARYQPAVESMEGAAFMYSCLVAGVPFAQVRAVSNAVERRNRAAWKIEEAVAALGTVAIALLESA
jgi:futalosine hydrolase